MTSREPSGKVPRPRDGGWTRWIAAAGSDLNIALAQWTW